MKISIALVSYNAEEFIKEQIDSILLNMDKDDELIISDDGSDDNTINIINEYVKNDNRIRLYQIEHSGCNANYENAIKHCSGEIIVLSDDDNVWFDNKLQRTREIFEQDKKITLLMHDCQVVDQHLNEIEPSYIAYNNAKPGLWRNFWHSRYGGSLIAFRKELNKYLLPFPKHISFFYDDWIGMMATKHGKVLFINEILSKWRRYVGSQSTQFVDNQTENSNKNLFKKLHSLIRITRERIITRIQKLWLLLFR